MKNQRIDETLVVEWAWEQLERRLADASPELRDSLEFAACAHRGQVRMTTGATTPYISHPVNVALLACDLRNEFQIQLSDVQLLAQVAFLHDTVEDCNVKVTEIRDRFGPQVEALVLALTKPQLIAHESSFQRQQRFCTQIRNAGPDAIYLKFCDLLHNLSELADTPQNVLLRAARKGRVHYLPLLDSLPGVGERFRKRTLDALSAAESVAKTNGHENPAAAKLESLLAMANRRKTELHDAVIMIEDVWGVGNAIVLQFMPGERPVLVAGEFPMSLDPGRLRSIRDSVISQGDFAALSPKLFRVSSDEPETGTAYFGCVERTVDGGEAMLVCRLERGDVERLDNSLQPAIAMRLILNASLRSAAIRRRELADEALSLGLEIDLDIALRVGVQRGQLGELAERRKRCEMVCRQVAHEIESLLAEKSAKWPLFHRVRVEWRVKNANSIIKKFVSRKSMRWPQFHELSDIAGVRVVCPTKWHVEAIVRHLVANQRSHPIKTPITRYDSTPTKDGYRGVHIDRVVSSGVDESLVSCEIQIRSFLEDSWATISHTVAYKERKDLHQRNAKSLHDLGDQLATIDAQIRELFEQFSECQPSTTSSVDAG